MRGRAPRRGARRRDADGPRALRDRDRAHRRVRLRPRRARARERYPRPGALPEVELGATIERGPGAPRLHRQRDGGRRARRRRAPTGPARARTCERRRAARPARRARSSTTRRGCCGSSATPRGSASRPTPGTRRADRSRAAATPSPATASATSCGCCCGEPPDGAAGCWTRYGPGRARCSGDGFELTWLAERAAPGAAARSPRAARRSAARGARRPPRPPRFLGAETRDVVVAAAGGFERSPRLSGRAATPSCGACLRARTPRDGRSCWPRRASAGAAALARRRPPPPARDHGRRPRRGRPDRPGRRRQALSRATAAMLDGRAPDRAVPTRGGRDIRYLGATRLR